MSFQTQTLREFNNHLAAREPVPGGGGVSALVGALAAALASMVAQYTCGKKAYLHVESDMKQYIDELALLRSKMLDLIDEDAHAFSLFDGVYDLPKGSEQRTVALHHAAASALEPPARMIEILSEISYIVEKLADTGATTLASDTVCAAYCLQAAIQCALVNVGDNAEILPEGHVVHEYVEILKQQTHQVVARMDVCIEKISHEQ